MIALKAEDVKTFTSKLFLKEDFDSFLVKEVNIVTYNNFTIDGHIRQGYYTAVSYTHLTLPTILIV